MYNYRRERWLMGCTDLVLAKFVLHVNTTVLVLT